MERSWEQIRQDIAEKARTALDRTEEVAKLGKAKLDISLVRRTINRSLADLGRLTYHLVATRGASSIETDRQLTELVEKLRGLYEQEKSKIEVYERLKTEWGCTCRKEEPTEGGAPLPVS